jgi:hypothetical protein
MARLDVEHCVLYLPMHTTCPIGNAHNAAGVRRRIVGVHNIMKVHSAALGELVGAVGRWRDGHCFRRPMIAVA